MLRTLLYVFGFLKENGIALTLGIANLGLVGYLFWKLFNNHLSHIQEDIQDTGKKIEDLGTDVKEIDKDVRKLGERVSKVEGKLEK